MSFEPEIKLRGEKFFVTSDTHYHHANICRGTSKWPVEDTRDFATLEAMDTALVDRINAVVPEDGVLFHLGDWSFGGRNRIWEFRRQLDVKTVHLLLGNHDEHMARDTSLHYLFDSVSRYKEIRVEGQNIVLFHYGMRVWNESHKGSWHLFGHSHDSLPPHGLSIDVGADTNDLKPYTFDEIKAAMSPLRPTLVDHHGLRPEVT